MEKEDRLGVFCFYDKNGIVGEYIKAYLDSMLPYLKELVIVCNGKLSAEGNKIFKQYTDKVYVRDNTGFDGGAYQEVILNLLGLDYIRRYKELLLFNDTVYAPIGSWEPVFEKMQKTEVDFWGLTQHYLPSIPRHIQSYFIMFRENILQSAVFEQFWRKFTPSDNKYKTVADFEINMSYFFEKAGFSFQTYSECVEKSVFGDPYFFLSEERLPILKTRIFFTQDDFFITPEERKKIKSYVVEKTDYDFYNIEKNMKRKGGISFFDIEEKHSWQEMVAYAAEYSACYIYGNTLKSCVLRNLLKPDQIKGILVSDTYGEETNLQDSVKIYKFSEVENRGEGLIVTLGYKNSKALKEEIMAKFPNAIFYWNV